MMVCERADRLAGEILTPSELEAFASLGDHERAELVTRTFSLKESLFKALYPLVKQRFYFQDAEVLEATPRGSRACACLSTFRRPGATAHWSKASSLVSTATC